jgi:tetratricopeptide (TPR) repeat protein
MNEEKDWLFDEDELLESVRRFEEMQKSNLQYFFDVDELEDIINYYFEVNNNKQASYAAEYAFKLHPESTAIQLKFAHHLIYRGKAQETIQLLNYIEKVEGYNYEISVLKGTAFNILGDVHEAKSQFDKAVSFADENKDEVLYNIGVSFEDRGQFQIAIDYFKEAYLLNPENVGVLYDLAYSSERMGKYDDSIIFYNKYLDEDPFSENVWYNLAIVHSLLENHDEAIKAYDYAIALNEEFASAYFNKGNLLFNEDRFTESLEVYNSFLELEPQNAEALSYIGECYEKLKDFDKAISYLNRAIIENPQLTDAWYNLANVYLNTTKVDEALFSIFRALDQDEDNTEYLFTLGTIYYKKKEYNKALLTFKTVTELDPDDEEAWMCYSELLVENHQLEEAIKILVQALGHNQDSAILNYRISSFYMLKGNDFLSIKYFEKGLKLNVNERQLFFDFIPDAAEYPNIKELLNQYL